MAPKCPARKGPKLMHGYRLLIGPEVLLSTMGKMRMSSVSTSVFYPLPYLQICRSAHPPFTIIRDYHYSQQWLFSELPKYLSSVL